MKKENNTQTNDSKVYLIGSGISALASAVYLINDANITPKNIIILEQDGIAGGACDGSGDPKKGYVIRGGRMHEEHYVCYWDLLSHIPSYENEFISIKDETFEFNQRFVSHAQARLIKAGKKVDDSSYGLSISHQSDMAKLLFTPESLLENKRIEDWFAHDFFETNFWYIWSTMFAFQKWSSLMEMRRYMKRFIHLVDGLNHLTGVMRTKYNQYHSVILPIKNYLEKLGVQFCMNVQVQDIDFKFNEHEKRAIGLQTLNQGEEENIVLRTNDYLFITNGSITESTDSGSWNEAAVLKDEKDSGSWKLWKRIASKDNSFGNPRVFSENIDLQKWYSFTATLHDTTFHEYMENFSGNVDGTGGLVTITDSNWLMSIVIARQPHFPNQPNDVKIFWGYGLYPDRTGNCIKKPMSQCNGKEILEELFYHLNIQTLMQPIMEKGKANCIPVAMPFIDSLFMPRSSGDRPDVIPKGAKNFAFIGQFAEVEDDCVFTVEYSVRTAQTAVYGLFETNKEVIGMNYSIHNPKYLIRAMKSLSS
ncbi:MAG: oleate hydratase [Candidatus Marinarcus sp.]|uniref:oleate hydratase n=1 Tax=Candidatus Marinarcus sp. TaxID=3100987 RepID=UPI003AFF97D4